MALESNSSFTGTSNARPPTKLVLCLQNEYSLGAFDPQQPRFVFPGLRHDEWNFEIETVAFICSFEFRQISNRRAGCAEILALSAGFAAAAGLDAKRCGSMAVLPQARSSMRTPYGL
jgi:hypothetical protein